MQAYIAVGFVLFLAGFTQGLSGFGAILMSLPLLAVFLDIKTVIPLAALAAQAITLMVLFQLKQHLDWKKILPLVVSALPGILVGVYFLKRMEKGVIHWILGITLIVYSLYNLFLRRNKSALNEKWAYLFGFLGGCLGGAFSAAGPPVIVYTSLCAWSKDQIKITLQGYFVMPGFDHGIADSPVAVFDADPAVFGRDDQVQWRLCHPGLEKGGACQFPAEITCGRGNFMGASFG